MSYCGLEDGIEGLSQRIRLRDEAMLQRIIGKGQFGRGSARTIH